MTTEGTDYETVILDEAVHHVHALVHDRVAGRSKVIKLNILAKDKSSALNKAGVFLSQRKCSVAKDGLTHVGITEASLPIHQRKEPVFANRERSPAASQDSSSKGGSLPIHQRKEPGLGRDRSYSSTGARAAFGKRKVAPGGEPAAAPKADGGSGGRHTLVISREDRPGAPYVGTGNKPRDTYSLHYHSPEGKVHKVLGGLSHVSSVHQITMNAVRTIHGADPEAKVHVKDASGEYQKHHDKVQKSMRNDKDRFPQHTVSEDTAYDPKTRTEREVEKFHIVRAKGRVGEGMKVGEAKTRKGATRSQDRHDNNYGAYAHSIVPIFKEEVEVTEAKEEPKKLKDIVNRPSRKWSEFDGNTDDEKAIVKRMRDNIVAHPDRNGNGDDVFKGSELKHNGKKVLPGHDEKKYGEWNGDVKNIGEDVNEDWQNGKRSTPIQAHHLDMHWATQHHAPQGSTIEVHSNKVVVNHPDGTTHHIEGGQDSQTDHKYKGDGKKTHAEAGKFTVVKKGNSGGLLKNSGAQGQFVSQNKAGRAGYVKYTHDESKAKEFHTAAHAQNHVTYHSQHLLHVDDHYEVHPKRSGDQVRAGRVSYKKAVAAHRDAFLSTVHSGGDPSVNPKVRAASQKIKAAIHPGLRTY